MNGLHWVLRALLVYCRYCSRSCQGAHWQQHKDSCKKLAEAAHWAAKPLKELQRLQHITVTWLRTYPHLMNTHIAIVWPNAMMASAANQWSPLHCMSSVKGCSTKAQWSLGMSHAA